MRTTRTLTLMTLMAVFLMLATGIAQAGGSKAHPVRESLEGNFVGMEAPAPEGRCSGLALLLHYSGTGHLTGIGDMTFESNHCSYLDPDFQSTGRYGEAEMVMTITATGEEIHATYEGRQLDETRYFEVLRITGGTGGFADARGVIFEIVTVDLSTFDVSVRGWGWMIS